MKQNNGRRTERIRVNVEFNGIKAFVREYITNVSTTGAFVRTRSPAPVGTEVDLRLSIIGDDLHVLEGRGVVVRNSRRPPGMGVAFTRLSRASRDLVARLVTREAAAIPLVR